MHHTTYFFFWPYQLSSQLLDLFDFSWYITLPTIPKTSQECQKSWQRKLLRLQRLPIVNTLLRSQVDLVASGITNEIQFVQNATFTNILQQGWRANRRQVCNDHGDASLTNLSYSELSSKIHRQFRDAHRGHRAHAGLDPSRASTGVVWCTERAYVRLILFSDRKL